MNYIKLTQNSNPIIIRVDQLLGFEQKGAGSQLFLSSIDIPVSCDQTAEEVISRLEYCGCIVGQS